MVRRFSRETHGKVEKFFDIFEKKVKFFPLVDGFFRWYNTVRPHGTFDLSKLETPCPDVLSEEGGESFQGQEALLTRGEEMIP